ncbi:MAG TPA: hypothetical protein VLU43_01330 [Anaeromyxobacteraceae bacterium]|nr:hypothetical protein [Anaeromyxobacteraceae bacterium]
MSKPGRTTAQRLSDGLSWLAVAGHPDAWKELKGNAEAEVKEALRDGLDAVAHLRRLASGDPPAVARHERAKPHVGELKRLLEAPGLDDGIHGAARAIVEALGFAKPGG